MPRSVDSLCVTARYHRDGNSMYFDERQGRRTVRARRSRPEERATIW